MRKMRFRHPKRRESFTLPTGTHDCPNCGAHYATATAAAQCDRSHHQADPDAEDLDLWGYYDDSFTDQDRGDFS